MQRKPMGIKTLFLLLFILSLINIVAIDSLAAVPTCTVDWRDERQVIDGFGGSGAFHQAANLMEYPELEKELILDLLFSQERGIGLSIVRNIIGDGGDWGEKIDGPTPSIEPEEGVWNWSGDEDQIWLMNEAKKRGCTRFMSTAWSPPAWMKTNNSVIRGGELRPDKYQAYAEYLANYVRGYKEHHNIEIYAVSITNEPDLSTDYSSCRWTGRQLLDFIKNYLTPTLKRENVEVKVMMPETMNFGEHYALETLYDPEAARGVDIIGTHAYDFKAMPLPVAKSLNKAVWQTEVSNIGFNDGSIDDGLKYAKLLHDHMTISEVNAWLFWWLVAYKPGEALIHLDTTYKTFTTFKRLYTIGNYSRFVRPGYVRINAYSNPAPDIYVTAYKDKASGKFAIVAINNGNEERTIEFNLNKFPRVKAVIPYRTSDTENLSKLGKIPVAKRAFRADLKAKSVTTFISAAHELPGALSIREILSPIQAEQFDEGSGIEVVDTESGTAVVFDDRNDYTVYQNYNFGNGTETCELRVAVRGRGKLEFRLNSAMLGTPVARYSVLEESTSAEEVWQEISIPTEKARGVNDLYLVFIPWDEGAYCKVDWVEFKPAVKPPAGRIKVQAKNEIVDTTTKQIKPSFKIVNNGSVPVDLAEVKVRYFYTLEATGEQEFTYAGGSVPGSAVTGAVVKMKSITPQADYYLEVGFTDAAGVLEPGEAIEVNAVLTTRGGAYRQDNDYSFRAGQKAAADWEAVTGYVKGQLCWGIEPSLLINPGFETGTTEGWFNFGGPSKITITDETAHTGKYCALITNRSESWQGIAQDLRSVMKPGATYEVSAWLKLKNKMNDAGRVNIKRSDDNGDNYTWVDSKTINDEEWTYISGLYEVKITGALKALELYTEGPAPGIEYYVDNVVVREFVGEVSAE
ncbi:MAG TPA: carbohydrate binding domain-containing protein [Bacillota bacterium]